MKLFIAWCVSAVSMPPMRICLVSYLSSPLVSLRKTRLGACDRMTPPFQNSKPVGLFRSPAKTVRLSALPSPLVSSRISSLSSIGVLGCQWG